MKRLVFALLALLVWLPALAQDSPQEERSLFTTFLENRLSTPDRQIRVRGIQGALSSEATIAEITIADRQGVWLRISNAVIDWSRSTLVLRQRLEIRRLGADSIEVLRRPVPREGLPSPEARTFSIPELPIAIDLANLEVPDVSFGQGVFGLESTVSMDGRLRLEAGSLDTALEIQRVDGPGGRLSLEAQYSNSTQQLDLDLQVAEPENGILANLLNVEGRPPLSLTLAGSGPVENLDLSLTLAVAGQPTLTGTGRFRQRDEGLGFTVDVDGSIERLIAPRFRGFFGAESNLEASGVAKNGGGIRLDRLNLTSGALRLEATADTASDGFPTALTLDASISDPAGGQILLPVSGGETSVRSARLTARYGESADGAWRANLDVANLQTGTLAANTATLVMDGTATNLAQPDNRSITFNAQGGLNGIVAERADIQQALGDAIRLQANGSWNAGEPLVLSNAELIGQALTASLRGTFIDFTFHGDIGVQTESIAPFSALAGRNLGGSLDLTAGGELHPVSGAFDLTVDGTARSLRVDMPAADALLGGQTRISGRLGRGPEGLSADNFRITNDQAQLTANGTFASDAADFRFDAALEDLALLAERAQGRLTASGSATGSGGSLNLAFRADVPSGQLLDKPLRAAELRFDGRLEDQRLSGSVTGNASLDGANARLQTVVTLANDERRLEDISFTTEGARLTGNLAQNGGGLLTGDLTLNATDISTAAALFLQEATGTVDARLSLEPQDDEQHASVTATLRNIIAERVSVNAGDVQANIADLFGVPQVEGTVNATGLTAAGIDVARLSATAQTSGQTTNFSADAALENGTDISTRGSLTAQNGGYVVALEQAELQQQGVTAQLVRPASLSVQGNTVTFQPIQLDVGGGQINAQGEIGNTLNVALSLNSLPLSIANTIRPDLALGGSVNGNATISGTRSSPQVDFNLTGRAITANALTQAGVSSLNIDATGRTQGESLSLNARVASPGGLNATAEGAVPLDGGRLALDVALQSFPVSLLNARLPNTNLGGTLTGSARVTGSLTDPDARFSLRAADFTAGPLAAFGAAPLDVTATGRFAQRAVTLESLDAAGPAGLNVSGSGRIPLTGSGLAVDASGTVPLALANRLLLDRGAQLTGSIGANLRVGGSLENPIINGTFSTADATAVDPMTNLRLTGIRIDAALEQNTVVIRSGSASFAAGGGISVSGTISTNADAGFPADLSIRLDEAKYVDRDFVTATVDGSLAVNGPLTRDPLLSGNIAVENAEIIVPEHFGGPAELNVRHIAPSPAVAETLQRARADDGTPVPGRRPSVLRLDLNIDAPARIFVRGRGLDAELGGSIRLTGPITSVQPVGGFRMIRGRFSILTQRLTFDEGTVTLTGDLDPTLNFVARTSGEDITVFVTVSGRVSDPEITFSSQPELPEDEVLARLIFNRSINDLSPLQLAQLAAAAAELAGGGNTSLVGALRAATGLADIEITTDPEGNPAVRVGNYIQENVYLGVETGTGGTTRGTINLDITDDLKARGAVGSNGDSRLGIFYERDY